MRQRKPSCHGMSAKACEQFPAVIKGFENMITFNTASRTFCAFFRFCNEDGGVIILVLDASSHNAGNTFMDFSVIKYQHFFQRRFLLVQLFRQPFHRLCGHFFSFFVQLHQVAGNGTGFIHICFPKQFHSDSAAFQTSCGIDAWSYHKSQMVFCNLFIRQTCFFQ